MVSVVTVRVDFPLCSPNTIKLVTDLYHLESHQSVSFASHSYAQPNAISVVVSFLNCILSVCLNLDLKEVRSFKSLNYCPYDDPSCSTHSNNIVGCSMLVPLEIRANSTGFSLWTCKAYQYLKYAQFELF